MSSPPTPVITEATLLKRQKNKEAAKASRDNKKQTTSAYEDYFNEMEQWHPQFQAKYNHLLELLTKARSRFHNDPLGVEMDNAFIAFLPRIPDTIVLEKTVKTSAGRPTEKASRRSRGYVANNPQAVPNFNAPPLMAQPGPQLGQFANPPPAANQQAQFPASAPQFSAALDNNMLNLFNNAAAQPSAPNTEFGGLDSGYSSAPLSPQPDQDSPFLRENIFNAAGFTMDDTSPHKSDNNMDFNSNGPDQNSFEFMTPEMRRVDWSQVDNNSWANNVFQPQQPQQPIAPSASYDHMGNNHYLLQPQQSQSMNDPALNYQNGSHNLSQPQKTTHFEPSQPQNSSNGQWYANFLSHM